MKITRLCTLLFLAGSLFGQGRPVPSPFVTAGSTAGGTCGALAGDVTGTCAATVLASIPNGVQDAITRLGTVTSGVWHGTLVGVLYGGTGADLSGTGGTSQVLKQSSAGAAVTVGTLASTNLSDTANIVLVNTPSSISQAGALSTPAFKFVGSPVTGGDGTTTKPLVLLEPTGTASAGWNTSGNYLGINVPAAFAGRVLVGLSDGVEQWWFTRTGFAMTGAGGIFATTGISSSNYGTTTNCSSAASPAVCAAAAAGSVVVAAAATTVTVNTSRVTAVSQILVTFDSGLGSKLSVTCNTTNVAAWVTARTAATSFTITVASAPTTNPACFSYTIIN